jgi:formylglycine-generating enzyme required for sulfatase activity
MKKVSIPVRLRFARLHGVLAAALVFGTAVLALPPALVSVPGPANGADCFGHGAVAVPYRIGTYEVTQAQYTEFLNAVAATDTYGLYNAAMAITRSGTAGAYRYSTTAPTLPVTQVSWYDAVRFTNWLHNGQPSGAQNAATTEAGAYTLTGAAAAGPRQASARFWLPSEEEWYKAAYYSDSGATAVYWEYPTGGMTAPTAAAPTAVAASANYDGVVGGVAPVGSYPGSAGPYGTFDQAGNVWEWTDTEYDSERVIRGGSWKDYELLLQAAYRDSDLPTLESAFIGFRVAAVPESGGGGNAVPVAVADAYSVNQGVVLSVGTPGVLGNDSDADGDVLTAVLVTAPAHGTVSVSANGAFAYTPASGYVGPDSFTYRASDGTASSASAAVTLVVTAVNRAPQGVADAYSVNQGVVLSVGAPGVLGNDSDADGDVLTAVLVTAPAHGTLNLSANGAFSYTPASGYVGPDSFTYRANDGTASSASATVTLTVRAVSTGKPALSVRSATARRVGSAYEVVLDLRNQGPGDARNLRLVRARLDRYEVRNVTLGDVAAGAQLTPTLRLSGSSSRTLSGTVTLRLDFEYSGGRVSISKSVRIASGGDEDDD